MTQSPIWLRRGRIPSLDGLRAIAVALVLCAHAQHTTGYPGIPPFQWLAHIGHVGVEVFFVLSGFLITLLMLREIERDSRLGLRAFYARRILRIVPAYTAFLVAVAVLQLLGVSHPRLRDWVGALTYTVNFVPHRDWDLGHCWSLAIEEHFYLIWPLLVTVLPARLRERTAWGGIALSLACRLAVLAFAPKWSARADDWTFCRLDGISAGCLLALWAWRGHPVLRWIDARRWSVPAVVVALSASLSIPSGKYEFGLAYTVNAACIVAIVWATARRAGPWLDAAPLLWLGTLSYSLYLWQQPFLSPYRKNATTGFPVNIALAFGCALACHYLVERPFLKFKDHIGLRHHGTAKRPGAVPATA